MNEATSSSATPRTKATAKTTAKAAATKTTRTAAKSTAKTTTKKPKCTGRIAFSANEINELAELLHVSADVLLGRAPLEVK